ncbi:hypothetical protein CPB84DRAFT_1845433 [Gymnopilus junonius]|uniref:Uncharacterized protein n=1 Tax=Gymnopilus junonius TaxID=109634 RepID=A0A9P5TQX2_GYMJU|nr:hypothetical protein CPB84DRAFT_1845433 [Gymnopilus junonius]
MHSSAQVIAQRALPATRTKARWQPYHSASSSACSTSNSTSRSPNMNTPNPSVASPLPTQASSSTSNSSRPSIPSATAQTPKETSQRDPSKHKFAAGLIDQAVITLSEIWHPQDIPRVFQPPSKGSTPLTTSHSTIFTSSTQPTPISSSSHSGLFDQISQVSLASANDSDQNLLPIKPFVHEVLRRSRTSGSILQAALCYLEADLDPQSQIDNGDSVSVSSIVTEPSISSSISTPPLPSPLLCPRRTFLASLILASKFFQDKCYSNRAWAKLSGLPPREIGRCERALGQALDWRLWVGKSPVSPQPASALGRTIVRSQSESSVFNPPLSNQAFLVQEETAVLKTGELTQDRQMHASSSRTGLRRCSTVPDSIFAARATGLCEAHASTSHIREQDQDMDGTYRDSMQHTEVSASSSTTTKCVSSSSPPTPPLTYSPTSTECSLGDRTVQMSTFEDNVFPSVDGSQSWLDNVNTRSAAIKTTSAVPLDGNCQYINGNLVLGLVGLAANANGVSIVDPDAYGGRYLWQEESLYRHVEPAGVH